MIAGTQESLAVPHGMELFQYVQCGQDWGSRALPACPSPEWGWRCWERHAAGRERASLAKENWSRDLSLCVCACVCTYVQCWRHPQGFIKCRMRIDFQGFVSFHLNLPSFREGFCITSDYGDGRSAY